MFIVADVYNHASSVYNFTHFVTRICAWLKFLSFQIARNDQYILLPFEIGEQQGSSAGTTTKLRPVCSRIGFNSWHREDAFLFSKLSD